MDAISIFSLAEHAGGTLSVDAGDTLVSGISKDTRSLAEGDVYLALHGENFDGNEFVDDAVRRGAVAAIVDRNPIKPLPDNFPVIRVDNTLDALHRVAGWWRDELDLKVVGVTGSSGKTSTKELTSAVLAVRYQVTKTQGNLNNHIGVPMTILNASRSDQIAVWEMGMSQAGEIAPLAALARPHIGIITNIGVAHIEFLKNREAIASEKADLLRALDATGVAIIPDADDFANYLADQTSARVVRAGIGSGDVWAEDVALHADGSTFSLQGCGSSCKARLTVPGEHMIKNALLAVAAGVESGLSLEECAEGLAAARLTGGRLQQQDIRGIRIIDDTYNANPDSMDAALATLASVAANGRAIAVLGKMGELGTYEKVGYQRVATAAAKYAKILITVGEETAFLARAARDAGCRDVSETRDPLEAARLLRTIARPGDVVLIKGSRSARMEQVIGGFN
ncbi:MAG: UDP-N-acetylmuramoyl-tripeptide--D-alanyl-D-alanine ligase [Chthoniobacterales bacterium]